MTGKTKLIVDVLGNPVPQTLNDDGKTYTVLANGDTTGINFRKYKLLRDVIGRPLPYQYFDVNQMKFVPGTIGGSGGAVDSVNGKTGIVNLIASDVGAASETDLSNLEQTVTRNAEVVTTHLAQNKMYAAFTKTANQSITPNVDNIIVFDNITNHNSQVFCELDSNGRIKVLKDGRYQVTFLINFESTGEGRRGVWIPPNYNTNQKVFADFGGSLSVSDSVEMDLNINDLLPLNASHNESSPINVLLSSRLEIRKVASYE